MDKINIIKDIEIFIKNNKTSDIPPYPIGYIPCNLQIKKEKVKLEQKKLFPDEKDIQCLKSKIDKEIENL